MSSKSYSAGDRGGGSGATGEARAKILQSISTFINNAKWADSDRADRVFEKVFEAPERFISPNPDTWGSYHQEASRIYHKIKDDHGLRLESELSDVRRDYEERAEQHLRREIEDQVETFGAETIDRARRGESVPQEVRERVDSVLEHHPPDIYDNPIQDARALEEGTAKPVTPDESAETTDSTDSLADETDESAETEQTTIVDESDETTDSGTDGTTESADRRAPGDMPLPELLGRIAVYKFGGVIRGAVSFAILVVSVLAPLLARTTVRAAYHTGRALAFSVKLTIAIIRVAVRAIVAFARGFIGEFQEPRTSA